MAWQHRSARSSSPSTPHELARTSFPLRSRACLPHRKSAPRLPLRERPRRAARRVPARHRAASPHRRLHRRASRLPPQRATVRPALPPLRRRARGHLLRPLSRPRLDSFASTPLPAFAAEVYASFDTLGPDFPAAAVAPLQHLRRADWLCSYGEIPGITCALRRPFDLAAVEQSYAHFEADFREFFPQLRAHLISCTVHAGGGAYALRTQCPSQSHAPPRR